MFRDIFKNRLLIGALAFLLLCVAGSLLYRHHEKQQGNERQKPTIHSESPVEGDTSQVVDIPDLNLRTAIAEALHKVPGDAITRAEMETLGELEAQGREITDLSGIAFAINLRELNVFNNTLSDISPVASLRNLGTLFIGGNTISDISPLAGLRNLGTLFIGGNTVSDISPLSNLTNLSTLVLQHNTISDISPLANLTNLWSLDLRHNTLSDTQTLERLMAQGTVVYFSGNPAFETPGSKIEDGWVWLILPATHPIYGRDAAASVRDVSTRDFLKEASGGAVKEADVAVNGATAGTQVANSVWTPAPLTAADPDNLNAIVRGYNLEIDIDYLVVYGVVSIASENAQQTRMYISGRTVQVWLNATRVYRNIGSLSESDYVTAVPVTLNAGDNLLFIATYGKPGNPLLEWGASFGFQDGTVYTTQSP